MSGRTYRVISKAELLTLLQKDAPCPIEVTQTSCVHRDVSERSRIPNYHLELLIHRYLPALNDGNTVVVLDEEALSIWLDDFGRVTAEIQFPRWFMEAFSHSSSHQQPQEPLLRHHEESQIVYGYLWQDVICQA
jgi:hypothetical protein